MERKIKLGLYAVKLKHNKFIHLFDNKNQAEHFYKNVDDESELKGFYTDKEFFNYITDNKQKYLFNLSAVDLNDIIFFFNFIK